MTELEKTLIEYIEFLNKANHQPISIAASHGWKCPQQDIEKGIEFRKQIDQLKSTF